MCSPVPATHLGGVSRGGVLRLIFDRWGKIGEGRLLCLGCGGLEAASECDVYGVSRGSGTRNTRGGPASSLRAGRGIAGWRAAGGEVEAGSQLHDESSSKANSFVYDSRYPETRDRWFEFRRRIPAVAVNGGEHKKRTDT